MNNHKTCQSHNFLYLLFTLMFWRNLRRHFPELYRPRCPAGDTPASTSPSRTWGWDSYADSFRTEPSSVGRRNALSSLDREAISNWNFKASCAIFSLGRSFNVVQGLSYNRKNILFLDLFLDKIVSAG